ncbi:fungal-specific transcription factor domain-domain-containing protein [Kockovaella imperatae]|uniref:Fungal-specific transcription factor domain-domain-containing protein n=1 Tax=Kockovaella imperatae TaxID=4999 RepID=A0A1Y1UEL6_9TREE|nr:fungal-specific transcription factor domain-domain-containing protein [Kockovaella imperatae]ORX35946.1 fungal-specific transcription factor domain-domain-containing protein [Kockovaella imperatae]
MSTSPRLRPVDGSDRTIARTDATEHRRLGNDITAGPSKRRQSSPHAFKLSSSVPESQHEAFTELLRKRQPPSCDACRTRKLKCSGRPSVIELGSGAIATKPCENCKEWSLDCSYLYQRKRRGRKNRVVERLVQEQRSGSRIGSGGSRGIQEDHFSENEGEVGDEHDSLYAQSHTRGQDRSSRFMNGPQASRRSSSPVRIPGDHHDHPRPPQPQPPFSTVPPPPFWTSPNESTPSNGRPDSAVQGGQSSHAAPPFQANPGDPFAAYPQQYPASHIDLPGPSAFVQPGDLHAHGPLPDAPTYGQSSQDRGPSYALAEPMPIVYSIEAVLPRELAMSIIDRYFEHVYCIIPVIHRPSFSADLTLREEERRPMLLATVFAIVALTLLHIPRAFFPSLSGEGVRKLSSSCLRAANSIVRKEMNVLTVDLICIKYFTFVIHNINGATGLEAAVWGEAISLAISLGLHREDSYRGLNPIETERRRRVWFLIFNADKFEAVFRARPILLRPDEFVGPESTDMPAELEDKAISVHGYLPSSAAVPLIVGFNILTRLVTLIGDLLIRERDVRRQPPRDPESVLTSLREVRKLQSRVKAIADTLPVPFKLDIFNPLDLPAPGWEDIMRNQLDLFYQDPMASETAKDGYLVMRANIHVTLAMTRLRIILHRDDLLNLAGPIGTPSRNGKSFDEQLAAELVAADLGESQDWRLGVYQDLFNAVHGLPIQALAANGPSLVNKIRVVAVTLIDALPAQDYGDIQVQGIAAYLLDFLNIMTSIESEFND